MAGKTLIAHLLETSPSLKPAGKTAKTPLQGLALTMHGNPHPNAP